LCVDDTGVVLAITGGTWAITAGIHLGVGQRRLVAVPAESADVGKGATGAGGRTPDTLAVLGALGRAVVGWGVGALSTVVQVVSRGLGRDNADTADTEDMRSRDVAEVVLSGTVLLAGVRWLVAHDALATQIVIGGAVPGPITVLDASGKADAGGVDTVRAIIRMVWGSAGRIVVDSSAVHVTSNRGRASGQVTGSALVLDMYRSAVDRDANAVINTSPVQASGVAAGIHSSDTEAHAALVHFGIASVADAAGVFVGTCVCARGNTITTGVGEPGIGRGGLPDPCTVLETVRSRVSVGDAHTTAIELGRRKGLLGTGQALCELGGVGEEGGKPG